MILEEKIRKHKIRNDICIPDLRIEEISEADKKRIIDFYIKYKWYISNIASYFKTSIPTVEKILSDNGHKVSIGRQRPPDSLKRINDNDRKELHL